MMKALVLATSLLFLGCTYSQARHGKSSSPPDRPVSVQTYEGLARLIAWMQPCVQEARRTFPDARKKFLDGLPNGYEFSVVARLRDAEGHIEQVFIRVNDVTGPLIHGVVTNETSTVQGFKTGAVVLVSEDEILDWIIVSPDGHETGNLIGKNLDRVQDSPRPGDACRPTS